MNERQDRQIEALVVGKILALLHVPDDKAQNLVEAVRVTRRNFSSYGFMSELAPLRIPEEAEVTSSVIGNLRASIDGVDCDFLIYLQQRSILAIEGYTLMGGAFPRTVSNAEFYELSAAPNGRLVVVGKI